MFAKVFSQIFDSSIAEDYNCRRMFMDLLVMADSDGVIDMTAEAIARRSNVPLDEVNRYLTELQRPDPVSRSRAEDGKRIILVDSGRPWGWRIVNYSHYRQIRDEEVRRSYFRDAQRKQRQRVKKNVKDTMVDTGGHCQIVPSASSSTSSSVSLKKGIAKGKCTQAESETFCVSLGLPASDGEAMFLHWEEKGWGKVNDWKATIRKWKSFGYMPSQKAKGNRNGSSAPSPEPIKKGVNVW